MRIDLLCTDQQVSASSIARKAITIGLQHLTKTSKPTLMRELRKTTEPYPQRLVVSLDNAHRDAIWELHRETEALFSTVLRVATDVGLDELDPAGTVSRWQKRHSEWEALTIAAKERAQAIRAKRSGALTPRQTQRAD